MPRITASSRSTTKSQRSPRVVFALGLLGAVAASSGWILEWIRQRGSCDAGNSTPDTLAISVLLIVVGGGVLGLIAVITALVGVRHARPNWRATLPALLSLALAAPIFVFAGAGPGAWFQYCGT